MLSSVHSVGSSLRGAWAKDLAGRASKRSDLEIPDPMDEYRCSNKACISVGHTPAASHIPLVDATWISPPYIPDEILF